MQAHQRRQRVGGRRARSTGCSRSSADKPHRLLAELDPHGRLGRRAVVALVEEQVERAVDGRQSLGDLRGVVEVEEPLRAAPAPASPAADRFSMAASELRNAAAISSTPKPHRMLSTSATCASSGSRGWQHENIMRSCSSLMPVRREQLRRPPGRASTRSRAAARARARSVRAVPSRRRRSSARFFAVAISHADGFSGTPWNFHTSSARQRASWTTSSASARLCTPKTRVRTETIRPASCRKKCSTGSTYMSIFMTGRISTSPPFSRIGHPAESFAAWSRSRASISE